MINTRFVLTAALGLGPLTEAAVIDADYGCQGDTERSGRIRLQAGLHPYTLTLRNLQDHTAPHLELAWSGPDIAKQPIPASVFRR
jgi:hypothetical protein